MTNIKLSDIQLSDMNTHDELAGAETSDKKQGRKPKACQSEAEAGDMALGADVGEMRAPDAELADGSEAEAAAEPPVGSELSEHNEPPDAEPSRPPAEQGTEQPVEDATETDGTPGFDAGGSGQLVDRSPLVDNDHIDIVTVHHSQSRNILWEQNDAQDASKSIDQHFVHAGEAPTAHQVPPQDKAHMAADSTLVGSVSSPHLAKGAKRSNAGDSPSNLLAAQLFWQGHICIQTCFSVQRLLIRFLCCYRPQLVLCVVLARPDLPVAAELTCCTACTLLLMYCMLRVAAAVLQLFSGSIRNKRRQLGHSSATLEGVSLSLQALNATVGHMAAAYAKVLALVYLKKQAAAAFSCVQTWSDAQCTLRTTDGLVGATDQKEKETGCKETVSRNELSAGVAEADDIWSNSEPLADAGGQEAAQQSALKLHIQVSKIYCC